MLCKKELKRGDKNVSIVLVKISNVNNRLIPLGLACLQAYLKSNDVPVKVFNFRATNYSIPKAVMDPLIQLKPLNFILNHNDFPILIPLIDAILDDSEIDFSDGLLADVIKDYAMRVHEDPSQVEERYRSIIDYIEEILKKISYKYNNVGFSVDYLNVIETILMSAFLKVQDPNVKIVWGGPSIIQSFEAFKLMLSRGVCDGLVIGEGEKPIFELASGKDLNIIRGILSLKDNSKNEFIYKPSYQLDLDLLPTPDYEDIPLDTYYNWASVYRSRGCTNRCKFCGEWFLFGPKFRVRSVENVVNDIEIIIKKHNPKYMIFGESLINDDFGYFENLCDAMITKDFKIKFGTHFRANITPELARKAYLAGFNDAWVGVEAFTDFELKEMNKGMTVNRNIDTIDYFTQAGINVLAMLVVGFSSIENEKSNNEAVLKTIKKFSEKKYLTEGGLEKPLKIQWRPAPAYLVPGSIDYIDSKKNYTSPWSPLQGINKNQKELNHLKTELSKIPYEFQWSISGNDLGLFIKKIQVADRKASFAIGGITEHVINTMMENKRKNRLLRKQKRFGVLAQRLEINN